MKWINEWRGFTVTETSGCKLADAVIKTVVMHEALSSLPRYNATRRQIKGPLVKKGSWKRTTCMARKEASHSVRNRENKMRQKGELLQPWRTEVTGRGRGRPPTHTMELVDTWIANAQTHPYTSMLVRTFIGKTNYPAQLPQTWKQSLYPINRPLNLWRPAKIHHFTSRMSILVLYKASTHAHAQTHIHIWFTFKCVLLKVFCTKKSRQ